MAQPIQPVAPPPGPEAVPGRQRGQDEAGFDGQLRQTLQEINSLQQEAAATSELFVRGEITDLHQVMVAAEKARLGLELMMEVRNKLLEGYQEIMRMQL